MSYYDSQFLREYKKGGFMDLLSFGPKNRKWVILILLALFIGSGVWYLFFRLASRPEDRFVELFGKNPPSSSEEAEAMRFEIQQKIKELDDKCVKHANIPQLNLPYFQHKTEEWRAEGFDECSEFYNLMIEVARKKGVHVSLEPRLTSKDF
jgi:hypothetical protein